MKRHKAFRLAILFLWLLMGKASFAAQGHKYTLASPDGKLTVEVQVGEGISYQLKQGNDIILSHSRIDLVLTDGTDRKSVV